MKKINDNTYGQIVTLNNREIAIRISRETLRGNYSGIGYRIDINTGFGPFEAIDNGVPFATLAEAKKFVTKFKRAAKAESTFTPSFIANRKGL